MLTQLNIKNYGLIDELSVDFHENLNVLTGETGAGKSIIAGALRSVLGRKMEVAFLRVSDCPCVIEAVFDLGLNDLKNDELIKDFMDEEDATLVIQRRLTPEGRNRIKINGQAVNLGQLKSLGNLLMDFNGPHDHQMLLTSDNHMGLLDQLCDFNSTKTDYNICFTRYQEIKKDIEEITRLRQIRERELDLLTHQMKDLEQVVLDKDVYQNIRDQKVKVDNAQNLNEAVISVLSKLDEGECSSSESIRQTFGPMNKLARLDETTEAFENDLIQLQETHDCLVSNLRDYAMSLQFDEHQALEINNQSDHYDDILRKYGPTIEDAGAFYHKAKERYMLLSDLEGNDRGLKLRLRREEKKLSLLAGNLSIERKKRARSLKKTIEKELKELGIAQVKFEVVFKKKVFNEHGWDYVEFFISPNAGVELKPMAEIVSSGEAARIMLALKKALIEVDPIPILVFDEIDAQIGGRLGTATGEKLRDISHHRQVILITHLPQIASFADMHFKISKSVKNNRAVTQLTQLKDQERIIELAQMMSGEKKNEVSLKHARSMLTGAGS